MLLFEHDLLPKTGFHFSGSCSGRLLKKPPTVIPGRNEGANPESSHTDFLRISGFLIAACAASGMTTEIFQQPASGIALWQSRRWLPPAEKMAAAGRNGCRLRSRRRICASDGNNKPAWRCP
jgi:hypothetical protein